MDEIKRWFKEQSKIKLFVAGSIIFTLIFITLINPRDNEYHEAVQKEIEIAKRICINSERMVLNSRERLKFDNNILNDVAVDGKIPKLKHIKYPEIIFMHNGYARAGRQEELYCTFRDPRGNSEYGSGAYYFDYNKRQWVARTKTRR